MMGGGGLYLTLGARSYLSFSRLHPCISATNSSEQVKILYRACKLKPYKKTACGVMSHVSLGLLDLCACRYRCGWHHFSGPTEKEEPMIWLANNSHSKTINRWAQLIWLCTSTWLLSTENHLKSTPRWTTAGIILNSRGVVTCRVSNPFMFREISSYV
jgi:hypothetical protein